MYEEYGLATFNIPGIFNPYDFRKDTIDFHTPNKEIQSQKGCTSLLSVISCLLLLQKLGYPILVLNYHEQTAESKNKRNEREKERRR